MDNADEIKAELVVAIQTNDLDEFSRILKEMKIPLFKVIDSQNCTIFHDMSACMIPESSLLSFLSTIQIYTLCDSDIIKRLINLQISSTQQSALHFAVQHNRRKLVKELINLGADPHLKDKNSHSALHISALSGKVSLLVYFKNLGLSPEEKDLGGRIPLHLSLIEGHDSAALYLTVWTTDLNSQDNEGMTALHFAALNNSYRVARNLILRGANKSLKDKQGRSPCDIALSKQNLQIKAILEADKKCLTFQPFKKKIKQVKNSNTHIVAYILIFLLRSSFIILVLWPRLSLALILTSLALILLDAVLFILTSIKDPGYIKVDSNDDIYETYRAEYICHYCRVLQRQDIRHCHFCARCVQDFDHHCPWIHNCVGKRNHKLFICFLLICALDFLYHLLVGVLDFVGLSGQNHDFSKLKVDHPAVSLLLALICFLGLLLVAPLLFLQVSNMIQNTTTSKRFAYEGKQRLSSSNILNERLMLLPESDGWISQRTSRVVSDYVGSQNENEGCCVWTGKKSKETEKEGWNPGIINYTTVE